MDSNNLNTLKITFKDNNGSGDSAKIKFGNKSADAHRLNRGLYETLGAVESLGRYDDFAMLKIPISQYAKNDPSEPYGILRDSKFHGTDPKAPVIRTNQESAALTFLSKLRGFGLLADCVGSGKTYEAGVVISELAVRGLVENILMIVPDTALLHKWKYVMERQFGMGEGQFNRITTLDVRGKRVANKYQKPQGAYIMLQSEFENISETAAKTYLFDLIVVDEAHHLCVKKAGEVNKAMYRLSLMMATKRECQRPYCLLLTATPHSGNLENMFNLWYFISCKGGYPEFFLTPPPAPNDEDAEDETPQEVDSADANTPLEQYHKEKRYYSKTVCKGAKTISEYIDKATEWAIVGTKAFPNKQYADKYLGEFRVLAKNGKTITYPERSFEEYAKLPWYEKKRRVDAFISYYKQKYKRDIRHELTDKVREAYTTEVMRAIMVRNQNEYSAARKAHSYFFLPTEAKSKVSCEAKAARNSAFFLDGTPTDHDEFFNSAEKLFSEKMGFKDGAHGFYGKLLNVVAAQDDFAYVNQVVCTAKTAQEAIFNAKCEAFVNLVQEQDADAIKEAKEGKAPNRKLIVFFDYDKEENETDNEESSWAKLYKFLEDGNHHDICKRIIRQPEGTELKDAIDEYNKRDDAIFFAESSKCTEGQDMQSGRAILNFEVPIDPLTMDQRIGRVHRLGQESDVKIFSFAAMNELDGYCLAYYVDIGILSDKNGDASILSGCNNDNMVAIQCKKCKRMEMLSRMEYDGYLERCPKCGKHMSVTHEGNKEIFKCKDCGVTAPIPENSQLRCEECKGSDGQPGVVREEISMHEYRCDKDPRHRLKRDNERGGYVCIGTTGQKELMNYSRDEENRAIVECDKLCAIKHCKGSDSESCDGDCLLKQAFERGEPVQRNQAIYICFKECKNPNKETCRCRPDKSAASTCGECKHAKCTPKPHRIVFDEFGTSAPCPICGKSTTGLVQGGTLRKVERNTFESYIRNLYENDQQNFCKHFQADAEKMKDIKVILKFN